MSQTVIKVSDLAKMYHIGHEQRAAVGTSTFRDALSQIYRKPIEILTGHKLDQESFWALNDINFEVNQGDVLGIIGKNGSGKSTLLKVLSRIVEPSSGEVIMRGKTASLLEVGTGFHPELTGRENIYFNGAILGMSRREIKQKFDDIVEFSEIEKFLDTPVKFYSSGMYVRLAFSVAAHLEPEILIVDEVLAVGDANFQRKSLGKMSDVASEGRTVLFVSHNASAILSLCNKGLLLDGGKIITHTSARDAINKYSQMISSTGVNGLFSRENFLENKHLFRSVELSKRDKPTEEFTFGEPLTLTIETNSKLPKEFGLELRLKSMNQELVAYSSSWITGQVFNPGDIIKVTIPAIKLAAGTYIIDLMARKPREYHVDNWWDTILFNVVESKPGEAPFPISQSDELGSLIFDDTEFKKC